MNNNEVSVMYLDNSKLDYMISWPGGKRRLRYTAIHSDFDAVQFSLLTLAYELALEGVSRKSLRKMDSIKVYKLVEKFATEFCVSYSPKSECGLEKRFIRTVILQAIQEVQAGDPYET
ncbi:hypothetical protein FZC83_05380 [Rossellomorea marisflavi]|uniref:Uncharacterized protein n=1 Tax=Rossellomorea marisflavi TaxID=189381 RepID=A0A5D4S020_9BACI|nr:hypothetical protein [Rossellomorea marisflavi]TYS56995.1 hypothetical protein FZC83_05380 [Rossellomorea marisflavi]